MYHLDFTVIIPTFPAHVPAYHATSFGNIPLHHES
jgi:hypothetical protein